MNQPSDTPRAQPRRRGRATRIVLLLVGLVVASGAAATLYFVREPMTVARWVSRRALGDAGLVRSTFEAPSGRLVYWSGGAESGPPLVLVHGMGDQAGTWHRVAGALARTHRLIVLDLPGHGESAPATGPLPFRLFPEAILALTDHLAPATRFSIVGSSMGGWIALRLALEHPERLVAVWSVDGAGLFHDIRPLTLTPANRAEARALFEAVGGPRVPNATDFFIDDYREKILQGATPRVMSALLLTDLLDARIGEVRTPVHLVWGENDELLPVAYAERLRSRLPSATLDVLPRCGHVPQMECPEEFLDAFARHAASP